MNNDFTGTISKIYRVLDFLPDGDPLKNRAKERALNMLDSFTFLAEKRSGGWISLKGYFSAENRQIASQLLRDLETLGNYFQIAKEQEWVNSINFLIIAKELDQVKQELSSFARLEKGMTEQKEPPKTQIARDIYPGNMNKGEERGKEQIYSKSSEKPVESRPLKEFVSEKGLPLPEITARQRKIIGILNRKERAQVSDIIKELPQVTKRTIRRDLDILLKGNIVVRIGQFNQVFYKMA